MNQTPEQRAAELYKEADLQGIADLIADLDAVKRLCNEHLEKLNIVEKQVEQLKRDGESLAILAGIERGEPNAGDDHDPAYQQFVEESAKYCRCQPPHARPCDGVLAGGLCDEMSNEPEYTLDDLDWHEAYD